MLDIQPDAAKALRLIDDAGRRSRTLRGYQRFSPHLTLWGALYAAGYAYGYVRPADAGVIWLGLVPLGLCGDALLVMRDRQGRSTQWRVCLGLVVAVIAFVVATLAVMAPVNPRAVAAFVPLVVGLAYIVAGALIGWRLAVTGVALAAMTLVGFFALPSLFMLWMAAVGGGALLLGGFWLARA